MVIVITCVIGGFSWVHLIWLANVTVRLLVCDYSQLSDYTVQLQPTTQWLIKYKAVNAPIKFEEIVKVMINRLIDWFYPCRSIGRTVKSELKTLKKPPLRQKEFGFFQSSLRLLQVTNFVKCRWTLLKLNSY